MSLSSPRVVAVRNGQVQPSGSWLYVWLDVQGGGIAYVGGSGFDPELRAYMHVKSEDPQLGRVRATAPHYDERDFDVLAFGLPDGVDRGAAEQALIAHLAEGGTASELREVTEPIIRAIEDRRG
ncbi:MULTISPECIES: hypothetical protein [unclassified Microbacterium]|uniref:hypothetical protein n=1 Tax=unclassified Microbacterium TaxID=2609290 RepID=UPI00049356E5|nr:MULTISPECIES: hypothetical protein [unclassified Microbacterium]